MPMSIYCGRPLQRPGCDLLGRNARCRLATPARFSIATPYQTTTLDALVMKPIGNNRLVRFWFQARRKAA